LLAGVPDDPLAAFVLAGSLEDQDDPRLRSQGELLRLVYALTRSTGEADRAEQEGRVRALLRQGVRPIGPYRRLELGGGAALDFAWVPPGVFLMGSPDDEEGRVRSQEDEEEWRLRREVGPRHQVTLSCGFWMGTTPVTQLQYARVVGHNPSWGPDRSADVEAVDRDRPVQEVTWFDAVAFLRRLSRRESLTPTRIGGYDA
jgi:formylglycine-generating enzyme required for sulfatase activity